MQNPTRPRIPHSEARTLAEGVLGRLANPTPHLRHVERLVVFGSFAYGLLEVDDLDLAIDYETKDMPDRAGLEPAAAACDQALAAVEEHERQLEQDARDDARELASDMKWLRQELDDTVPPASDYLGRLRERQVPTATAPAPADEELKRLADQLQQAYDDWSAAVGKRVPFPEGTPSVAGGAALKQMIDDLTAGNERIYVYYNGVDALDDWDLEDVVLLWERGDSLEFALSRLQAIKPDATAKKKQKKPLYGGQP